MKTPSNGGRAGRVEKRAVKTMGRAQKNWTKAEAIRKFDKGGSSAVDSPAAAKANKLYDRSARQGEKAKRQMEKADYLKAKKAVPGAASSKISRAGGKPSLKDEIKNRGVRNTSKWDSFKKING